MRVFSPPMRMNKDSGLTILRILVLGFHIAVLTGGCTVFSSVESANIPQDEIRQTYLIRASGKGTSVFATFSRGSWGASVDLEIPSRVEDNGIEMSRQNNLIFAGVYYTWSTGAIEKSHTFTYTNNRGRKFVNKIEFEPIEIINQNTQFSRDQEKLIVLSRPVRENEKIQITLTSLERPVTDSNSNATSPPKPREPDYEIVLHDELTENRSSFLLKPKNLGKFAIGRATLKIEVSRTEGLKQATAAGGSIGWIYESAAVAEVVR